MKTASIVAAALLAVGSDAGTVRGPGKKLQARDELAYSPDHYPSPWMDPEAWGWEEAYVKAKDFVSQLTLPEKVNLTTGVGWMGERCLGNIGSIPRLGMRGLCMQDSPLGMRSSDYNTAYGAGISTGATWSRRLFHERGSNMGLEYREKGADALLGPVAGPLGRAPAGGRNWEGFAADPYLAGIAFAETIMGIQEQGTIATAKHYVTNEQEHFRQAPEAVGYGYNISESLSSNLDDRTLHELYAWPFADAVKAGVGSIMCSYNQINNSYGCQNSKLLNGVLKDELGFQGFVMSDWQAQHSGVSGAAAGLEMSMPGDTVFGTGVSFWGGNLTLAVVNGTIPEWRLDDMATRIMAAFYKVGKTPDSLEPISWSSWTRDMFGYIHAAAEEGWSRVNFQKDVRYNHAQHVREAGAKGTVVLKNENKQLPLQKPKFLAVVGEDAGPNLAGPNGCDNRGCDNGTLAMGWGSGTSEYTYLVTPDAALQNQALEDGTRYESILHNNYWAETQLLVSQPDVTAIVFANADSGEGFINIDGNEGDRKNLTLWKNGDELIKNVSSICPNTIVVLHTVGPVLVTDWYENPNITAIVWSAPPGQESGNSLADILYGKESPGRNVFTWGPTQESYGTDVLYEPNNDWAPQQDFTEGLYIDYRHFDRKDGGNTSKGKNSSSSSSPIYEFGYGLTWTTFEYSNLQIQKHDVRPYAPTEGQTIAAPACGNHSTKLSDYAFPDGFHQVPNFIYPWLNDTSSAKAAAGSSDYGMNKSSYLPAKAFDGSPQPKHPAGGAPGGNPMLWDELYTVIADIKNTGDAVADEIPQLYVGHGGDDNPLRVLRGFDRLEKIFPGETRQFRATLTRRDLSNWDVSAQNWVVTDAEKKIWVGSSSRKLPLTATLD